MFNRLPASIIRDLQMGDEPAFDAVYRHYRDLLYVIVYAIVGNPELSQDLLQDTFLKVFTEAGTLSDPGAFHAWIIRIAKNMALNAIAKKRDELLEPETWEHQAATPDQDDFLALWHKFLTDEENLIIAYRIVYELTFLEISRLMDKPLTSVYMTYRHALGILKREYGATEGKKS